jgi:aryl-alcohol dehydrogenase-like predicted oxidoreductase
MATVDRLTAEQRDQVERYEQLCHQEIGASPAHVALAWLLSQPEVTCPIIGPRTLDQLRDSLPAIDLHLDDDMLARLDAIFPGPGGQAPEAYAW